MSETPKQKRNTSGLRPFQKGQSGNPGGRAKEDPQVTMVKNLTKSELAEMGSLLLKGNKTELEKIIKDPGSSMLKIAVASVISKAINKGDMHSLDILLNRLIGKVKDQHDFSGIPATPQSVTQVVISIPSNGREKKPE